MQHDAAFHLGLHCLPKYLFRGFPVYKGLVNIKLVHVHLFKVSIEVIAFMSWC